MKNKNRNKATQWLIFFHDSFLTSENVLRDVIITLAAIAVLSFFTLNYRRAPLEKDQVAQIQPIAEETNMTLDTSGWKVYQSGWYGFELKYPEGWSKPLLKDSSSADRWEYLYQFRKKEIGESDAYAGFDLVVYNTTETKEFSGTDEFPSAKSEEAKLRDDCQNVEKYGSIDENYSAEKVYVDWDNDCYDPAYFYTLARDGYIFNIVPVPVGGEEEQFRSEGEIREIFPEFAAASSTLKLVDIERPKFAVRKLKINAPFPNATLGRDALGRLVCVKKNDHPEKSDVHKHKHMDMECCLDPDEYPNPWCYYPVAKYGKYL